MNDVIIEKVAKEIHLYDVTNNFNKVYWKVWDELPFHRQLHYIGEAKKFISIFKSLKEKNNEKETSYS